MITTAFKREILRGLPNRPSNMWRYQDVLPLTIPPLWIFTPLAELRSGCRSASPRTWLGIPVYIKDERYGPTSSFKDRQAAVAVAAMLEGGMSAKRSSPPPGMQRWPMRRPVPGRGSSSGSL